VQYHSFHDRSPFALFREADHFPVGENVRPRGVENACTLAVPVFIGAVSGYSGYDCRLSFTILFLFLKAVGLGRGGKEQDQASENNEGKDDDHRNVLKVPAGDCLFGYGCRKILYIPVDEID